MAKRTLTDEERARLLAWLETANRTVYTLVTHVARSGMSRTIRAMVMVNGEPIDVSRLAADLTRNGYDPERGVRMHGCGMDMGFELIYEMSHYLWPDGHGCDGEKCNSNDHNNGDRDYTPGDSHWHRDGGYRLRQRWL